jgi:hypothetical protein
MTAQTVVSTDRARRSRPLMVVTALRLGAGWGALYGGVAMIGLAVAARDGSLLAALPYGFLYGGVIGAAFSVSGGLALAASPRAVHRSATASRLVAAGATALPPSAWLALTGPMGDAWKPWLTCVAVAAVTGGVLAPRIVRRSPSSSARRFAAEIDRRSAAEDDPDDWNRAASAGAPHPLIASSAGPESSVPRRASVARETRPGGYR